MNSWPGDYRQRIVTRLGISRFRQNPSVHLSEPRSPFVPSSTTCDVTTNTSTTSDQGTTNHRSVQIFASLLIDIVNHEHFKLSHVRRITIIESILAVTSAERNSENDMATTDMEDCFPILVEIMTLGVLASPTLSNVQRDFFLQHGVIQQRWDIVMSELRLYAPDSNTNHNNSVVNRFMDNDFLNYRKMILCVLRSSRKLHAASVSTSTSTTSSSSSLWQRFQTHSQTKQTVDESPPSEVLWKRLKGMIVQTKDRSELDDLLRRILERTCLPEVERRISKDLDSGRYDRFLLPDRFDCDEGVEGFHVDVSPVAGVVADAVDEKWQKYYTTLHLPHHSMYKNVLLSNDDDNVATNQEDGLICPICLHPVHTPAVQLKCDHVFCYRCLGNWMNQSSSDETWEARCPLCRTPLLVH